MSAKTVIVSRKISYEEETVSDSQWYIVVAIVAALLIIGLTVAYGVIAAQNPSMTQSITVVQKRILPGTFTSPAETYQVEVDGPNYRHVWEDVPSATYQSLQVGDPYQ